VNCAGIVKDRTRQPAFEYSKQIIDHCQNAELKLVYLTELAQCETVYIDNKTSDYAYILADCT